jgi:hypothetical protein
MKAQRPKFAWGWSMHPPLVLVRDEGVLVFLEVEAFNKRTKATIAYDVDTASVYSFTGTTWVGYDDALSIINYNSEDWVCSGPWASWVFLLGHHL